MNRPARRSAVLLTHTPALALPAPVALAAADLLLQLRPARRRDRQRRDVHGAGLSSRRFRAADDPGRSREAAGADQPDRRAGWPRQGGRLVLPPPQGKDRLRRAPPHVTAL